jgi:hypothetical protein
LETDLSRLLQDLSLGHSLWCGTQLIGNCAVPAERAWDNALRLAQSIDVVILDYHLMRSEEGAVWLDELPAALGKRKYIALRT